MKAAFIARHGVTKCPRQEHVSPPIPKAPSHRDDAPVKAERIQKVDTKPPKPQSTRDLGSKPVLMWVPVSELHIDSHYQRNVSTKRGQAVIKDIVANFQWPLFQPITITQRDESGYWVIDGQHRMLAAQQVNIREIPAVLLENLTQAQQARAFAGINGKRVSVNAYAIHHAMIAAEDQISVRLASICAKSDVSIPRYPKMVAVAKPNETMAIAALKTAMKVHGDDALIWALRLIRATYPDEPGMITAYAVKILSRFYSIHADYPISDAVMQEVLLDLDLDRVRDDAAESANGSDRVTWAIARLAQLYNGALPAGKQKLPATSLAEKAQD
ncbi:DUF6551 family protein [Roseicella sp. DB1501]|uniref:DUF6551 family protein n=1 Tax=Roseicella sp. DB1501 TaxID=2730925 RepID=UPI0014910F60|nr:DUF6551 family protein [Roseicella sp. DB1501]NOG70478.1 ParB N-terminal domain-containing protein [Roseicella sp. DB1501]